MIKRMIFFISAVVVPAVLPAQLAGYEQTGAIPGESAPEAADTLRIAAPDASAISPRQLKPETYDDQVRWLNANYRAKQMNDKPLPGIMPGALDYSLHTPGLIASWGSGGITGSTGAVSLPGLMGMESGSISLTQNLGNFSVTAYGTAVKYGYYGGLDRTVGFGGAINYRASDRVSITFFGSYFSPLRAPQGAMAGYVSVPRIGGYVDYSFNEHWGLQVGAQSYRSSLNGEWHTQPIAIPYYRISKDAVIGMDVGGILYNLLYRNSGNSRRAQNPTIPIPKMGTLPVGSRE